MFYQCPELILARQNTEKQTRQSCLPRLLQAARRVSVQGLGLTCKPVEGQFFISRNAAAA